MSDIFQKLREPFPESDIEWRIARSGVKNGKPWGKCLAYITARAVQDRLDSVVGSANWRDEYIHINKGVMCRLSIRVNDEWVTKENGAEETDIESFKGGISKSLVRAASTWGIGRYLYNLTEGWAQFTDEENDKTYTAKIEGKIYDWLPPPLPAWALPESQNRVEPEKPKDTVHPSTINKNAKGDRFISEKQINRLFAIAKANGLRDPVKIIKLINDKFNIKHPNFIKSNEYDSVVGALESFGKNANKENQLEPPPISDSDLGGDLPF